MRIAVKFQIRCKAFQQQKDLRPSAIFRHREEQELCLFQALHGLHTEFFDASVPVCVRAAVSRIQNGQICRLAPQRVTGVERAVLCIVARKENALSVPFKSQPDAACAVPGTPPCDLQAGQFRHRAGAFARAETFQRLDMIQGKGQLGQSRQRSIDRPLIPLLRQPRQRPGVVCVAVGQKDSPQFLNLLCIQPGQGVLCASQQTAIHQKSSTILFHIKAVAAMFAAAPGNKKFHLNAPSDDRSPCSRSAVPWSKTTHTAPPSPCQPKRCPAQIPAR